MTTKLPVWASAIAVFDTETTGLDTTSARIVTANISVLDADGAIVDRKDWIINPGVPIPPQAAQVHGITDEIVQKSGIAAPAGITQIVEALKACIQFGLPLVAYNAPYDFSLLRAEAARYQVPWLGELNTVLDPLVIDKAVDRYRKGKRTLVDVAAHYGVSLDNAHDAGSDAIAAGRVLQKIALVHGEKLPETAAELHLLQVDWARDQAASFRSWLESQGKDASNITGDWPLHPAKNQS
ncbi:MAG: exonuclease domain-containing protein [Microbacteriaceae bacterium]|nr:exonuclease domain-containing protein [Microbacteriaceae bacterium]